MLGDIQLMTASMCDGLQCIHHSWARASSMHCLSKGRTRLFSYSQSVYDPLSNSVTRAHGCVCLGKGQPCGTAAGCKHTFLHLSDVQASFSYCLPRWHTLPCQFLVDTVSSQLMRPLAGRSGPGGPHLCSLGDIAEGVRHTWCSEVSMRMAVSSYQSWLLWKVYYSPGESYAQSWSTYLVSKLQINATHIKTGFSAALIILKLWCVQDLPLHR